MKKALWEIDERNTASCLVVDRLRRDEERLRLFYHDVVDLVNGPDATDAARDDAVVPAGVDDEELCFSKKFGVSKIGQIPIVPKSSDGLLITQTRTFVSKGLRKKQKRLWLFWILMPNLNKFEWNLNSKVILQILVRILLPIVVFIFFQRIPISALSGTYWVSANHKIIGM